MKLIYKTLLLTVFCFWLLIAGTMSGRAALLSQDTYNDLTTQSGEFQEKAGFSSTATIGSVMAIVIEAFLGLLGIIFIFLIVLAGYHWMTAAGDEQKVTKAKDTLRTAVIGLIIIVAAYSITYFVFKALGSATGTGG